MYALAGIAAIVLGIVIVAKLKDLGTIAIVIIIVGVAILVISFFGWVGAGYKNDSETGMCGLFMYIFVFFVAALAVTIVLLVFGIVCFFAPNLIESNIALYIDSFKDLLMDLTDEKDFEDAVSFIVDNI